METKQAFRKKGKIMEDTGISAGIESKNVTVLMKKNDVKGVGGENTSASYWEVSRQ